MINNIQLLLVAIILILSATTNIYLALLYERQQKRANILQEQLDIRRYIEKGNRADKILWDYHDVTYLNNSYNIKVKNVQKQHKTLKGDTQ